MLTTPTYRANVTDKQQSDLEQAQFDGGIPHFEGDTKVIAAVVQTAPGRVTSAGAIRSNAGVVMPHDDIPNRFYNEQAGRA